jgi:RNA polymerase sigma factor (sigma-70 family)
VWSSKVLTDGFGESFTGAKLLSEKRWGRERTGRCRRLYAGCHDTMSATLDNVGMNQSDNSSLATRASLLGRLKDLDDQTSWQEFFDAYWRLIYSVALKAGLTDAEAQDVVQETIITAAKHLPGFHYDRTVCTFKTWLLRLARWRIIDQLRKRLPAGHVVEAPVEDDATATALMDRLTGGVAPDLEQIWSEEWEKLVLAAAIDRAKQQVRPEQFQIFDLYALKGMPASQVARLLGVSVARVYLAKHRVAAVVRAEVLRQQQAMPNLGPPPR